MDMFHDGTHIVSKLATEDVISSMPDNVITNVLDRLPIQDVVKTSVLSKKWRLKWTLLTQLIFNDKFFNYFQEQSKGIKKYNGRDICRLLLHLKGPITKFVLHIPSYNNVLDYGDIHHWILFLSRKDCKELTIMFSGHPSSYKLPTHVYSCIELKHLKVQRCCFRRLPSFSGFPNLFSLDLCVVTFVSYNWAEFAAQCPLLEILKVSLSEPIGERELNHIAKLVNLKTLYLTSFPSITLSELSLPPKLEELSLSFSKFMFLGETGAKRVPTGFPCLKNIALSEVDFNSDMMVSFLFEMICGSPNLQTLQILARYNCGVLPSALSSSYFACNSIGQPQLQSVVFSGVRGLENEVYLIKYLLACSPLLKSIGIGLNSSIMVGGADGKFMLANKMLKFYRSSPMVEIDLY